MRAEITGDGFELDVEPSWGGSTVQMALDIDGEPYRYPVDMTPTEARELASALSLVADAVEKSHG